MNKYGNCETGKANYTSSTKTNEIIEIMLQKVQNVIITEVKIAKHYSITPDSSPNIS